MIHRKKSALYFFLPALIALLLAACQNTSPDRSAAQTSLSEETGQSDTTENAESTTGVEERTTFAFFEDPPRKDYSGSEETSAEDSSEVSTEEGTDKESGTQESESETTTADSSTGSVTELTGEDITVDTEFYPYYAMLNESQQAIYRQMYAAASAYETTFVPAVSIVYGDVKDTITALYWDHPELFWIDGSTTYEYESYSGCCTEITITFYEEFTDSQALKTAADAFQAAADKLLAVASSLATDYEKEKYIHDALAEWIEYDYENTTDLPLNQSAYSALVWKTTVCSGYARSFQYLMIELGIPVWYCNGYADNGITSESHAWNIVRLSDGYYNVDVTWDDVDPLRYDYFNITDKQIGKDHTRLDLSVNLAACTATGFAGLEN